MIQAPRRSRRPRAVVLSLVALLTFTGGCSFDRNWKRLAAADAPSPTTTAVADPLAGRWEGSWQSTRNSHRGKLRAIIAPADGNDARYRADFDATYLGLLRFGYSMKLTAAPANGDSAVTRFQGEENLGWLAGGVYRYDGTTDGQTFDCTYQSKSDEGTFTMTRPAP